MHNLVPVSEPVTGPELVDNNVRAEATPRSNLPGRPSPIRTEPRQERRGFIEEPGSNLRNGRAELLRDSDAGGRTSGPHRPNSASASFTTATL